jgi:hypothetical protein
MPGKYVVQTGPWEDGVGINKEVDELADKELFEAINLEITNNGIVRLRRPINQAATLFNATDTNTMILGSIVDILGVDNLIVIKFNELMYVLRSGSNFNEITATTINITGILNMDDIIGVLEYKGRLFAIGKTQESYFSNSSDPASITAWTRIRGPIGYDGANASVGQLHGRAWAIYQERLYVATEGAYVYYSDVRDFTRWDPSDANVSGYFIVRGGSGVWISFMVNLYNALYIFTSQETYMYAYSTTPVTDQYYRKVNNQGAMWGIIIRDNLYLISQNNLYLYANNLYYLQTKNGLPRAFSELIGVNSFDGYILFSYTGGYIYQFNITNGAITEWTFRDNLIRRPWITFVPYLASATSQWSYTIFVSETAVYAIPYKYVNIPKNRFVDQSPNMQYIYGYAMTVSPQDVSIPWQYKTGNMIFLIGKFQDRLGSYIVFYDYAGTKVEYQTIEVANVSQTTLKAKIARQRSRDFMVGFELNVNPTSVAALDGQSRQFVCRKVAIEMTSATTQAGEIE